MPVRASQDVVWVMRKPRSLGNFSIETSYRTIREAWPDPLQRPDVHTASRFTSGVVDRFRIWREVTQLPHPLVHVTGDIHFSTIGLRQKRVVHTIHDLGMLDEGGPIKRALKSWFWLRRPLLHCDHIIAVSTATRDDILRRTGFPADRITVIPSVISPTYRERETPPDNDVPRVLHIGMADNKNLNGHAAALSGLDVHLRIIGEPSEAQQAMLRGHNIDFSWTSKLSEEQLQAEYAGADLLLFCSTLEGYGMPIIEAQTIGLPVITSRREPMEQTAGEGALLVNPDRPLDIREAVMRLLSDAPQRMELTQKGRKNAASCSAAASARMHADLYARLLSP